MGARPSTPPPGVPADGCPQEVVVTRADAPSARHFGDAGEAMRAVSRLLTLPSETGGAIAVQERVVAEARGLFGVSSAVLLSLGREEGLVEVSEMSPEGDPPFDLLPAGELAPLAALLRRDLPVLGVDGEPARDVARALGVTVEVATALLLPMRRDGSTVHVLCLFDEDEPGFDAAEAEVARAFATAAAAALGQVHMADSLAAESMRRGALVRAAKALNGSLDVDRTLARICAEAVKILDADNAAVLVGDERAGLNDQRRCTACRASRSASGWAPARAWPAR